MKSVLIYLQLVTIIAIEVVYGIDGLICSQGRSIGVLGRWADGLIKDLRGCTNMTKYKMFDKYNPIDCHTYQNGLNDSGSRL